MQEGSFLTLFINRHLQKMRDILHVAETARKKTILPFCVEQFAELEIFCILLAGNQRKGAILLVSGEQ